MPTESQMSSCDASKALSSAEDLAHYMSCRDKEAAGEATPLLERLNTCRELHAESYAALVRLLGSQQYTSVPLDLFWTLTAKDVEARHAEWSNSQDRASEAFASLSNLNGRNWVQQRRDANEHLRVILRESSPTGLGQIDVLEMQCLLHWESTNPVSD